MLLEALKAFVLVAAAAKIHHFSALSHSHLRKIRGTAGKMANLACGMAMRAKAIGILSQETPSCQNLYLGSSNTNTANTASP